MKNRKVVYAGLAVHRSYYDLAISDGQSIKTEKINKKEGGDCSEIFVYLKKYSREKNIKIIALGSAEMFDCEKLADKLWLDLDIVSHIYKETKYKGREKAVYLCQKTSEQYDSDNLPKAKVRQYGRVSENYLNGFGAFGDFMSSEEYNELLGLAGEFRKRKMKMVFINATASGGGVAIMRHAMLRMFNLLNIDVSWHVLKPSADFFFITKKKFHNVFQAVADPNIILTDDDKRTYESWLAKNAKILEPIFKKTDVVVIDDPQPAGLIPHIKTANPRVKIFYRSHIEIRSELIKKRGTQQHKAWSYLWQFIKLANIFVSHPVPRFVPPTVKKKKLVYMPPSVDPLDGLNKNLSSADKDYYMKYFQQYLERSNQKKLDSRRPYLIQIARFDPSKGIFDLVEAYRLIVKKMKKSGFSKNKIPQMLIVGNGSVDDPEGVSIYEETRQLLEMDKYSELACDIKVARLPHNDQLLNTLLSGSTLVFQLSHKEGFEFKVTEALMKNKPVIAYRAGGIPLQIDDGKTGYLVGIGNTKKVAEYAYNLLSNKALYKKMSLSAGKNINHNFFVTNNIIAWLKLALKESK